MITSVSVIQQDTGVSLSSSCFPWRLHRKMNKAEMQKSVATLETEAASCMAWESRANIPLSIRSPKLLHRHRKATAANTENILWGLWGLWGHPGCCWQVAAPESCSAIKTGAEHPCETGHGGVGSPEPWELQGCTAQLLSFAMQGCWPGLGWCCWGSMVSPGAGSPRAAPCSRGAWNSSPTALRSVSSGLNGPAPWKDEIYGWAIKEKLERKIYNFPLKPVIHVINIDVI